MTLDCVSKCLPTDSGGESSSFAVKQMDFQWNTGLPVTYEEEVVKLGWPVNVKHVARVKFRATEDSNREINLNNVL